MSVELGTAYAKIEANTEGFSSGIKKAQSDLDAFQNKAGLVASGLKGVGGAMTKIGGTLTKTVTAPILGVGAAAVKTTATFDQSMSKVAALSGATGKEFDALRAKAIEMGAQTAFSASESADALSYMALAGWDTQQMLDGLPGILDLAASSQMDLAQASDMVTDFLTAFGLEAADSTRMADQLAYAQAHSNTTTQMLGDAFENCAANMHSAGQTMETTTAILEAMANQGTKGSEAGTALSAVMRDITQKMDDGAIAIGDVAVAVEDENGNFRNLIDILADVEAATDGMGTAEKSAALSAVFTARSIKAVKEVLTQGTASVKEYEAALYDVDGTAREMSEKMLNNLNGQLTILKSTMETLLIQIGDILMPYMTKIVAKIKDIVTAFTELDVEQKEQIIKWAAIAASIGPALLVGGKLLTGMGNLISTGSKLIGWLSKAASAFGIFGGAASSAGGLLTGVAAAAGPILAVVGAVAALGVALKALYDQGGQFTEAVDRLKASIGEDLKNIVEGAKQAFEDFKNAMAPVVETIKNSFDFEAVDSAMADLVDAFMKFKETVEPLVELLMEFGSKVLAITVIPMLSQMAGLINGVVNALGPLIQTMTDIVNLFTDQFKIISGLIKGLVTGDFSDFIAGCESMQADTESIFLDLFETIKAFYGGFIEGFLTTFDSFTGGLLTDIKGVLTEVYNAVVEFFTVTIPEAFNNFINVVIPTFINGIKQWFNQLPYLLGYAFGMALVKLQEWGENLYSWVVSTIPTIIEGIMTWFRQLPGKIYEAIHSAYVKVVSWGVDMRQRATEIAKAFFNNTINWFKQLPNNVMNYLKNLYNSIVSWGSTMKQKATEIAKEFFDNMINWFRQLPDNIASWISQIPGKILAYKDAMKSAGTGLFTAFWQGLQEIWEGIAAWFEGIGEQIASWVASFKQGIADAQEAASSTKDSKGSHAGGLAYVPYNGYVATLHEGERVLTRNEAEDYNRGGYGNIVNNFYSPKAIDAYQANRLFKETVRQLNEGFA